MTGASSGIGESLCRELVDRGGLSSLVLVARREDRLVDLAAALRHSTPALSVEVLAADLTDAVDRRQVEERLSSPGARPPVDLLVNNAGLGTAGPFWRLDPDGEQAEIDLNVSAVVALTRAALPGMVEQGRGAVVSVSSLAAYQPSPGMATYSATKAFVTLFSESLFEELRGTGVSTTAVLPGYTRTEFQEHLPGGGYDDAPAFAWMSARSVAAATVDAAVAGRALCVPGLGYKAAAAALTPVPRSGRRWLMGRLSRFDRTR